MVQMASGHLEIVLRANRRRARYRKIKVQQNSQSKTYPNLPDRSGLHRDADVRAVCPIELAATVKFSLCFDVLSLHTSRWYPGKNVCGIWRHR